MSAKRNGLMLFLWGLVWSIVFWVAGLFVIGLLYGLTSPDASQQTGEELGRALGGWLLIVSIVASSVLTYLGMLPGTRKRPASAETADRNGSSLDLASLERLAGLRDRGVLTEAEFQAQKARMLGDAKPSPWA
jgi:hypothetical protein